MAKQPKIVTITNITQFANFMVRSIRARLKWSSQLRKSVVLGKAQDRNGVVSISIQVGVGTDKSGNPLAGMARAYEYGSGEKGKKGEKYSISPKNRRALWFPYPSPKVYPGTATFINNGQFGITTKHVWHPGVNARPFIAPAKEEALKRATPEFRVAIINNLKKSLRVTLKQIGK